LRDEPGAASGADTDAGAAAGQRRCRGQRTTFDPGARSRETFSPRSTEPNEVKELTTMPSRREMLKTSAGVAAALAGLGLLPGTAQAAYQQAAFDAKTLPELIKALGISAPVESKDVTLTGPDIAENGAVVPVACASTLPGVKRLMILVEKNPSMLCALFDVSDAVEASFATRVKMGQSSNVTAVALMADGKVLFAHKEIKVTLGGCGG
jgi:sulfur-oxidizing protein SoxY